MSKQPRIHFLGFSGTLMVFCNSPLVGGCEKCKDRECKDSSAKTTKRRSIAAPGER